MRLRLAVLPGDGVGPEVTGAAVEVLRAVLGSSRHTLDVEEYPVGWAAVKSGEKPLPEETRSACLDADAVFLGAVGHPDADGEPPGRRPEAGLLELRKALGCWANLRPVRVPDSLVASSALRPERVRGTDLMIVRELGGGLYYGEPRGEEGGRAWNTLVYEEHEVRRIAELAFGIAERRRGRVTSVDKANVLEASRLWRRVVDEVATERADRPPRARPGRTEEEAVPRDENLEGGADVKLEHMLVDRAAMELVLNPTRFDVLLTSNLFGDVLSDEAATLPGSLGLLASASLGGPTDLYEPVHGSAPDIAGTGKANPTGAILSMALMLRETFGLTEEADAIESAVDRTLADGIRTADLASGVRGDGPVRPSGAGGAGGVATDGPEAVDLTHAEPVGTTAFTDAVLERLEKTERRSRPDGDVEGPAR